MQAYRYYCFLLLHIKFRFSHTIQVLTDYLYSFLMYRVILLTKKIIQKKIIMKQIFATIAACCLFCATQNSFAQADSSNNMGPDSSKFKRSTGDEDPNKKYNNKNDDQRDSSRIKKNRDSQDPSKNYNKGNTNKSGQKPGATPGNNANIHKDGSGRTDTTRTNKAKKPLPEGSGEKKGNTNKKKENTDAPHNKK